ncbi:MAG: UDP-N-acetylmuramoyl-L-alanine--D-glutamate ligase [Lachnospiraceae bacterium]|nr:UDP-N-acetylmuramoyl-L-alanine--D-glutamate ligase [Lachnospiraceae bacterium]
MTNNPLTNKYILVAGFGVSGISAVKLLKNVGAIPLIYDSNHNLKPSDIKDKLDTEIDAYIGEMPPSEIIAGLTMAVFSPGVNLRGEIAVKLKQANIPIIGEIELAYMFTKGRIIAITGTNGKTTTVTLVGEIMKARFQSVYVVGNIGLPFCDIALQTTAESIIVLETSSYQLETIKDFTPYISAILNITEDHLERHETMEKYIACKERITLNQNKNNTCIVNYDSENTVKFISACPASVIGFSSVSEINNGCYLKGDTIYQSINGNIEPLVKADEVILKGTCNMENIMAAILISREADVPMPVIIETVKKFKPVPHRIEYVATINNVDYYNDSKATNPDAAIHGIRAMTKPTILIAGGSEKKSDYTNWLTECKNKIKALVLIGETKEDIAACATGLGIPNIYKCDTLQEALEKSRTLAALGDAVLLSPACASFGLFKNYEHRGDKFKELVKEVN